ncbi:MAG: BrnT family toxin [Treponema sp.]|nr:BrnT family toxin [Treponema sp.]
MQFEWDEAKNEANKRKHGIDFADAQYVFAGPLHKERYDGAHSSDEDRWIVNG